MALFAVIVHVIVVMFVGWTQSDFGSNLEQIPATVRSPDTVLLKCQFDRTMSTFGSIVWSRGPNSEMIYARTEGSSQVAPGYEDIVVVEESQVRFSEDGSSEWAKATLTMRVTRCLADTYQCLITDISTRQSECEIILSFEGE